MNWWQYLIPDNLMALGIWYFLLTLFALWLCFFVVENVKLRRKKKQISDCENIESLVVDLKKQIALRSKSTGIKTEQISSENSERLNLATALSDFYQATGIKKDSEVAEHVSAIFDAGWNNSQLQIESLIKNTANRLFRRNGLLRSILSLFIILGLLGTLFGLAYSLGQLLPLMPNGSQLSSNVAAHGLGNLLNRLRGAFAPSIWGVGLTIIGVLLFSFYLHSCQLVKDELERLTLTVWVPKLFPSPFQQQLITLVQTEELIRQNRENIQTVADFAANTKTDIEGFGTEIKNAKTTIKNLNTSSSQINEFADKFHKSVEKLLPFQEDLAQLYRKMVEDSTVFQEGVSQSLHDTTEVQRQARDTLTEQSQQLKEVIERLYSYEGAYVESRQELDAILKKVMEDARKAYQDIGERNQEIVAAIDSSLSVPLRGDLTAKLDVVNETLTTKLGSIVDRFGTFEAPIKTAAQNFEQIVSTIDTRAGELMARLQHEYNKQNESNEEQLEKLEGLNRQLISFIETLTSITSKQETSYTKLGLALPNLEGKLTTLNEVLNNLVATGFPTHSTGGVTDTTGIERLIRDNSAKLIVEVDKLVRITDEIRRLQASQNGRKGTPQSTVVPSHEPREQPHHNVEQDHNYVYNPPTPPPQSGLISKGKAVWRKLTGR